MKCSWCIGPWCCCLFSRTAIWFLPLMRLKKRKKESRTTLENMLKIWFFFFILTHCNQQLQCSISSTLKCWSRSNIVLVYQTKLKLLQVFVMWQNMKIFMGNEYFYTITTTCRQKKGIKQVSRDRRKNEGKKGLRIRQSNGPSTAARAALSWSQSPNHGWGGSRVPGYRRIPEPACTLGTPGGGRWSVPHWASEEGWQGEVGLGVIRDRRGMDGNVMGWTNKNS